MLLAEATATTTDAELVGLTLAGDGAAFHQLFDRHRDRVTAVCRQRLRSSSDVDDAVQEAFARALANLRQLRDHENFGPWIRSIAVRACMDHHRAASRLVPVDDARHGETEDNAPLPDEMLLAAERDASLRATFAQLGERDRQALWMRHVSEAPVAAVALELGLTEGSTRVLLTRARHRLRAATTSLPALLPLSWRQWIRDHFPAAAPALDALVVVVALTLATGAAGVADAQARRGETALPAAAVSVDKGEPAAPGDATGKAADTAVEAEAGGGAAPATPKSAGAIGEGERRGPLNRLSKSVQIRREKPSPEETDELIDLNVFTDGNEDDEQQNNLTLYARQVQPVVDAMQPVLKPARDAVDSQSGDSAE